MENPAFTLERLGTFTVLHIYYKNLHTFVLHPLQAWFEFQYPYHNRLRNNIRFWNHWNFLVVLYGFQLLQRHYCFAFLTYLKWIVCETAYILHQSCKIWNETSKRIICTYFLLWLIITKHSRLEELSELTLIFHWSWIIIKNQHNTTCGDYFLR